MSRRFRLRPRAESDLRSAFHWYESKRPGLGAEFLMAVRHRLEEVREFPEAHPVVYRNIRRAVVSRFPYLVFYVTRPASVDVLGIMHHARSPARWPRT